MSRVSKEGPWRNAKRGTEDGYAMALYGKGGEDAQFPPAAKGSRCAHIPPRQTLFAVPKSPREISGID